MIVSIRGTLLERDMSSCVIEAAGVGYGLGVSANTAAQLGELGQEIMLYTYLQVREDAQLLYGFISKEERHTFEKLIGVSGIGPNVALAILSTYTPQELVHIIIDADDKRMSQVPGVGKKTASRIILELKSVFEKDPDFSQVIMNHNLGMDQIPQSASALSEAVQALLSMGFVEEEAELALKGYDGKQDDVAATLQYALKRLGRS